MDERLQEAARAAVERGLDFLEGAMAPDGGWPSWRYDDTGLVGGRHLEYPPFAAGLGSIALDACHHPRARALVSRTRDFLRNCIRYPGAWGYGPGILADVDDTAICSLAVGPHP